MDPGAPPGGFERLFEEFDSIVSRHPAPRPSPIEPNPSPSNPGPADEPPWWEPEELTGPEAEAEAPESLWSTNANKSASANANKVTSEYHGK